MMLFLIFGIRKYYQPFAPPLPHRPLGRASRMLERW